MTSTNSKLNRAKKVKNDEFYTTYETVSNELSHYDKHLKNKVIYCNCDNPKYSNFYKYFKDNFASLGLKKLMSTYVVRGGENSYLTTYDGVNETRIALESDGDFRSAECIEILKKSDVVITNPPFSLFREFFDILMKYEKKFLIIGNVNAVTYKNVFPYIMENKLWVDVGDKKNNFFKIPKSYFSFYKDRHVDDDGNRYVEIYYVWYNNISRKLINPPLILNEHYSPEKYPKYDNYDAIEVSRVKDIPYDYDGVMGVPITFIFKYNPNQFEIIGEANHGSNTNEYDLFRPILNDKPLYKRILIKNKNLS